MDKKLTLSINQKLINKAKKYAQKTGQSLSGLVESYFQMLISYDEEDVIEPTGVVAEMAGAFKNLKVGDDYKQEIRKAVRKKYG